MRPCANDGYDFLSAESLAKQAAKEPSMSTPPTDTAQRLVQAADLALLTSEESRQARAAVVAVLRELETSGVFDPQDSAVLNRLADQIEGGAR